MARVFRRLGREDLNMPYESLLERLDTWLGDYPDPLEEINECSIGGGRDRPRSTFPVMPGLLRGNL